MLVGDESENVNPNGDMVVLNLEPGQTWSNDYGSLKALLKHSDSNNFKVIVTNVCFDGADCYKNGYFDCNGKQTIGGSSKSGNVNQQYTYQNNAKGNAVNTPSFNKTASSDSNPADYATLIEGKWTNTFNGNYFSNGF